jgi:hypothetical protein
MEETTETSKVLRQWLVLLPLVITFFIYSCKDVINEDDYQIKKIKANPTFALPLAFGDLVINDLLSEADQTNIKVYNDGLVYLLYEQTLKSQGLADIINFPDRTFTKSVPVPSATLPPRTSEIQYGPGLSTSEDFGFSPERLTEIKFKNATVRVAVNFTPSNLANAFEVEVRLPNFQLNGVPFQRRITTGAAGVTFALRDYVATLTDNAFPLQVLVFEKPHATSVVVPMFSSASVQVEFRGVDYQYIRGFFGDQTALNIPPESIDLDAFGTSLSNSNVSFAQPKLSFNVSNDYGIPTKVTFNPLQARKANGTTLPIAINPTSPVSINVPASLGLSASTDVSVTNTKQLIDFVPDEFFYRISARINEGLTSGTNFCADTSKIRVKLRAEIPLWGKASNIVLADTFALDLGDAKDSQVESGALRSKITNQIPLEAFVQFYLANENEFIFDSLFTTAQTELIKSSTVDAQGVLVNAGVSDTETPISKEKLDKLFDAKKLIVKVTMNTAKGSSGNQVDVQFKSSYKMNVNLGLKVKLKLEADL